VRAVRGPGLASRRTVSPASRSSPSGVLGSGLSASLYSALVVLSIALFMTWGGPLWSAPREASHVSRLVVSYLAVVPLATLLLLATRRFSWTHLATATGSSWAIKLVLTSVLYFALARGTATTFEAKRGRVPLPEAGARLEYQAARGPFATGTLTGVVVRAGAPVAGAVVALDKPSPGAPLAPARDVTLRISGSRYDAPAYLAHTVDSIRVENADPTLHTLHLYQGARSVVNEPLTASPAPHALRTPEPGAYELRCDNHPAERAVLVVVDHPYAALSDEGGRFFLPRIPAGHPAVVVVDLRSAAPSAFTIAAPPEERTERTLDLESLHAM
jgi:plastocyanin